MSNQSHAAASGGSTEPSDAFDAQSLEAALTVADLTTSLAWYRDVLGFVVEREFQREGRVQAVRVRAGAVRLLLGQDDQSRGAGRSKGEGFSLQLTTRQDVDGIAQRVKLRGGTLESEPADISGARAFRLRDPDGFKLTISSPRWR